MALSVNGGFGSKGSGSNPNLLDNGWFTVNQRGATTVTGADYGADRWSRNRGGVTFGDGYVDLSYSSNYLGAIQQVFEKDLPHGTYTGSVMLDDGTIYSGTINYTGGNPNTFFTNSKIELDFFNTTKKHITVYGMGTETVRVKAVKVERGSVSTLALDSEPNYTTELLKCQRYFYKIQGGDPFPSMNSYVGIGKTTICTTIPTPTRMRAVPTVTVDSGSAFVVTQSTRTSVTINSASASYLAGNSVNVTLAMNTSLTANSPCAFYNVALSLSADL